MHICITRLQWVNNALVPGITCHWLYNHYSDIIMSMMASQITSLTILYSTVYSGADQRKHQSSASLAFVRGIQRGPVNSPHKWPVMQKMFPFDDIIMWGQGIVFLGTEYLQYASLTAYLILSKETQFHQICFMSKGILISLCILPPYNFVPNELALAHPCVRW